MARTLTALVLGVAALLIPASASGVWGGAIDSSHPQVGAMYFDYEGTGKPRVDGLVCSGSYAGAAKDGVHDVFLLAGHCVPPPEAGIAATDLYVSFSSNSGVTDTHQLVTSPIQVQQFDQMPGFDRNQGDPRDLSVLLIPKQQGIIPVRLAPAGYLDSLKAQGSLNFRPITLVGYGAIPDWDSPGPTTFGLDGKRRTGSSIIIGLGKALVRFSQNNGIGTGSGLCFGDSGSPQIDENVTPAVVISVTSGGNGQCNSNNYDYRVDTPQAREFLGQYLNLP